MSTVDAPVTRVSVTEDLLAEQAALVAIVEPLAADGWATPTASPRWSVTDQIAHLAFFDRTAALAIVDPDAFRTHATEMMSGFALPPEDQDEQTHGPFRALGPAGRMAEWAAARAELADAAERLGDRDRVIWYGPSMGAKSFLTARLMECWAHGQDVADALGVARPASDRLSHIVRLGINTRGWTYLNRGLEVPEGDVAVSLEAPSGAMWSFGDPESPDQVTGSAEDFCLVVTQRRHVDATGLEVRGGVARDWMEKAQAFAGPATDGPTA